MASSDANPAQPLRILAVVEWYPPAYKAGGPVRSVHNLMQLLKAQTPHHLEVVCGDRDLGRHRTPARHLVRHPHRPERHRRHLPFQGVLRVVESQIAGHR